MSDLLRTLNNTVDPASGALMKLAKRPPGADRTQHGTLEERFQDFSAGTFFKTMLDSLRSTQKPPKYMFGGQTEKIFQKQLDEQLAETLASEHGASFSKPLYDLYSQQLKGSNDSGAATAAAEGTHALDLVA